MFTKLKPNKTTSRYNVDTVYRNKATSNEKPRIIASSAVAT